MRFSVELDKLMQAGNIAANAVAIKPVKPILSNILMLVDKEKQEVRFVGTDQEMMLISSLNAKIEEGGFLTIPARLFTDVLSSLHSYEEDSIDTIVDLEIHPEETHFIELKTARKKFNLQYQGVEEFPPVPSIEQEQLDNLTDIPSFSLKTKEFATKIKEVSIAMSTEDTNPVQRSLCFNFTDPEKAVFVATDNKRLAVSSFSLQIPEAFRQVFILPSKAVNEIAKLLDLSDNVQLSIYNKQLVFKVDRHTLITRLVDGRFPDHNRLLPKNTMYKITINRKELLDAMKTLMPFSRELGGLVNFEISANETRLWSNPHNLGLGEVFLNSKLQGEPISIGFNNKFIQDFIGVLPDEEIIIEMTSPKFPGLLRPSNPESDYKYVIMPMTF